MRKVMSVLVLLATLLALASTAFAGDPLPPPIIRPMCGSPDLQC